MLGVIITVEKTPNKWLENLYNSDTKINGVKYFLVIFLSKSIFFTKKEVKRNFFYQ